MNEKIHPQDSLEVEIDSMAYETLFPQGRGVLSVKAGKHRYTVFASELAALEAKVEPNPEAVKEAHDRFQKNLGKQIAKYNRDYLAGLSAAERAQRELSLENFVFANVDPSSELALWYFQNSPAKYFFQENERGFKPFRSLKVVKNNGHEMTREEMQMKSLESQNALVSALEKISKSKTT